MSFIVLVILSLQIIKTIQQDNYDEDIDVAYPITIYYRMPNIYSSDQILNLYTGSNCTCKEFAGVETHCYGSNCKSFPSTINTSALCLKIKLTYISVIKKDDFINLQNIKCLDINSNVKLTDIVPGSFQHMKNLRNLSIVANTNLKYLAWNVFEGLVNVNHMYFQKNGFARIVEITQALSPQFLPQLQLLDLSESMFRQINATEFHPMNGTSLTQLNLILCQLEFISPDCLLPLKNLKFLYLGQNVFDIYSLTQLITKSSKSGIPIRYLSLFDIGLRKIIPNNLMEAIGASNITSLSLASNHFDYIDDFSFPYMPNLVELDLRSDYIGNISANALKKLPALRILRLGGNKLFSVPKGALAEQITYLDLAGNTLEGMYFNMQEGIFTKMTQLQNLQLSYNSIFCLSNQSLAGLNNLLVLNLKKTDIYHIEEGAFIPLKKLQHLNLMENKFTSLNLKPEIFKGLRSLKELLLGGCSVKNLTASPNIFIYMLNLTYISLEKTNLHMIASDQLVELKELHTLNLADNKLAAWSKPILPKNLKILYAQQNKITHFTDVMLEDYKHLQTIYLDGNPFSCDCSLFPLVTWMRKNRFTFEINSTGPDFIARCIAPEIWRQKSMVDFLKYLDNNSSQCQQSSYNPEIIAASLVAAIIIFVIFSIILCVNKKRIKKFYTKTCRHK